MSKGKLPRIEIRTVLLDETYQTCYGKKVLVNETCNIGSRNTVKASRCLNEVNTKNVDSFYDHTCFSTKAFLVDDQSEVDITSILWDVHWESRSRKSTTTTLATSCAFRVRLAAISDERKENRREESAYYRCFHGCA